METAPSDDERVLTKSVIRAAHGLGLSDAELAAAIGFQLVEMRSILSGSRFIEATSAQGQLALQLARLYLALCTLIGNDLRHLRSWMQSHNEALGALPAVRIQMPDGMAAVVRYAEGVIHAN